MKLKRKEISHKRSISFKLRKGFVSDILIVIGVVLVWRGIWHLTDEFLIPAHPTLSALAGLLLGLFCLYLPDGNLSRLSSEGHHEHRHFYYHQYVGRNRKKYLVVRKRKIG